MGQRDAHPPEHRSYVFDIGLSNSALDGVIDADHGDIGDEAPGGAVRSLLGRSTRGNRAAPPSGGSIRPTGFSGPR